MRIGHIVPPRNTRGPFSRVMPRRRAEAATLPVMATPDDLLVAAIPIVPRAGDECWAFHVVNNSAVPIDLVVLVDVDYEWGGTSSSGGPGVALGPIPPRTSREIFRDTDSEVRVSLSLLVRRAGVERRVRAEFGRMYAPRPQSLQPIPVVGGPGKLAVLEEG
jgi:hypothetical protein